MIHDDTMFPWLLEKNMKTNMSHNGGKLKGSNWIKHINMQNDQKSKEVDAPFSAHKSRCFTF